MVEDSDSPEEEEAGEKKENDPVYPPPPPPGKIKDPSYCLTYQEFQLCESVLGFDNPMCNCK